MRLRILGQYALLLALLGVFGLLLIYPIWLAVRGGFAEDVQAGTGFTLRHVGLVFADPLLREGLVNAVMVAVMTTLLSMILALPLAYLAANYRYPFKGLWNTLVLVPFVLPPFVGAIGMKAILGRFGAVNTLLGTDIDFLGPHARFWGVVIVEALHLYPIIYLNAMAAMANLDPALDEAAQNLGVPWWRRLSSITAPLVRPGLFAGATIVFIWSFTELGTPLMFDFYAVTPVQIFNGIKEVSTTAQPYALTVVLLACALLFYVMGKLVLGGRAYEMYSKASRAGDEARLPLLPGLAATSLFAFVTFLAIVPHFGVVLASFAQEGSWYRSVLPQALTLNHYGEALGHPLAFGSIVNSLIYSSLALVVDIVLGLMIAYLIVRSRIRGRMLLDTMSMMPLAVPGLVMAFGFVALSIQLSSVWPFREGDPFNLTIVSANPNPIILLVVAYAIRRLPYVVRSAVAGIEQTSGELEQAAVNLGASTVYAVRKIIVPLVTANLIAGGLLAFSFAMIEVSDSLILAQQERHFPITKAIYSFAERLGDGHGIASAMGVWCMALMTVTLAGASLVLGRRLGAIFRV